MPPKPRARARGRRPRGHDHATRQGLLPADRATPSSTWSSYYLAVADGALRGAGGRPMALKRFVNGAEGEPFFQKRAPESRPDWIETVELSLPVRPHRATRSSLRDAAQLALDRQPRLHRPQPAPGARRRPRPSRRAARRPRSRARASPWDDVRQVALVAQEVLADHRPGRLAQDVGLARHPHQRAHRAALDLRPRCAARRWRSRARSSGARPTIATSKWWKEERHGVFLDYNQNAKDRTVASAYSVRPTPDARVSMPLRWDEVADVEAADFTLATVPAHLRQRRRRGTPASTRRSGRSTRCSSCRRATRPRAWATRRGRRTTASRKASRRASSRRASAGRTRTTTRPRRRPSARRRAPPWSGASLAWPRSAPRASVRSPRTDADRPARVDHPADRDRPRGQEGRGAGRPRALEGAPRRRRRAPRSRPTSWSTRCAAATRPGRASASTSSTCPRTRGRRRSRSTSTTTRGSSRWGASDARGKTGRPEPRASRAAAAKGGLRMGSDRAGQLERPTRRRPVSLGGQGLLRGRKWLPATSSDSRLKP